MKNKEPQRNEYNHWTRLAETMRLKEIVHLKNHNECLALIVAMKKQGMKARHDTTNNNVERKA